MSARDSKQPPRLYGTASFYSLSLLIPLVAYNLALKIIRIAAGSGNTGLSELWSLIRSDLFLNLGFSLFWMGAVAIAWRTRLRWLAVVSMHLSALVYVFATTSAHGYFDATGTFLDFGLVTAALAQPGDVGPVVASEAPWLLYSFVFGYALLGPLFVTRAATRIGLVSRDAGDVPIRGWLAVAGLVACALALWPAPDTLSKPLARDPVVQLIVTANLGAATEPEAGVEVARTPGFSARLVARDSVPPPNVVLIILESTGAAVTNPYSSTFEITPFFAELAERGTLVERAYMTTPHTSKALISILCGIEPRPTRALTEALPGLIPATCLPELLEEQGYRTVFFQAATEFFEDRRQLVENFGFQEFLARESMDSTGFEGANYFGFEDAIMLEPSRLWLKKRAQQPFFAIYLTNTPHHDYQAPRRYGRLEFVDEDQHNRYLNTVRYLDFFVRDLLEQYRELRLMETTLFLSVGDHGEAFGEHGRKTHDDVLYEEVARVPFIVTGPRSGSLPSRIPAPASLLDILPTIVDLAGFDLVDADYPGASLARLPDERTFRFSCYNDGRCLGQLRGTRKLIHYYGQQPDELYDLAEDPLEERDLAGEEPEEVQRTREELREWASNLDLMCRQQHRRSIEPFLSDAPPSFVHPRRALFGDRLALIGYDLSSDHVVPGDTFHISYHFEVKERIPRDWRVLVEGEGPPASNGSVETTDIGHRPLNGLYRLRYWRPGSYVTDVQTITIPPAWASATFNVYLGFVQRGDTRLPVSTSEPTRYDRVLVVSIPVNQP